MNKTGLIAKISIKYVLPTCIGKYFWRILRFLGEFRGSATARNIGSPDFVFEMHVHVLPLPSLYLSGTLFILKEIHHSGWKVVEINA